MAGRGKKTRLADVGGLGLLLGQALRLERLAQLLRALCDALLQALLGIEQGLLMPLEFGDVGISGDEAAAGHRLPVNAVHLAVAARRWNV